MTFRWIALEPFVIPSGSMETTLLVQDYVVVKKWSFGLRIPFTRTWLWGPQLPQRGDIVVFKAVDESGHFLVKRVVGLPGDTVDINSQGFLTVNKIAWDYSEVSTEDEERSVFIENNGQKKYQVQFYRNLEQPSAAYNVPEGHIFLMGDNRNQSADSRFWGPLPIENLMGKMAIIWMSCNESETLSSFLCAPKDFRWDRFFKPVD